MPERPFECRFAVGQPNGPRSSTWKVWAARNSADLYVAVRSFGGQLKGSIHASGARHFGLTSQTARRLIERGTSLGRRHLDVWNGGVPLGGDCSLELRVRFPTSHLREWQADDAARNDIIWITPAAQGQAVEVVIIFGPITPTEGWPGKDSMGTRLVAEGRLSNQKMVWIIYSYVPEGQFRNHAETVERMRRARVAVQPAGGLFGPGHRIQIASVDNDGSRAFTEWAADIAN